MKWEELQVYKPLTKEELKPASKDFTKIIAENLKPFGFTQHRGKLIRSSNDLFQIIHLDTRGSWAGVSEFFKIEISLVALSDRSPFIRGFELTGSKEFEEISNGVRNHYRITREYRLLADFLTRQIAEKILPYFAKYSSSRAVLSNRNSFSLDHIIHRNENLVLFCELQNRINIQAEKIIDKTLAFYSSLYPNRSELTEYFEELELYKNRLAINDWSVIEQKLETNKLEVFKKLKIGRS